METLVCQNERHWVETVHDQLISTSGGKTSDVFLPAGETPRPLYRFWRSQRPSELSRLRFIQIDEILDGAHRFATFFREELGEYTTQMRFIDDNPGAATGATSNFGAEAPAHMNTIAVLGLGLNGHVGFHEPGVPKDFAYGQVALDRETCRRLKVPEGTKGLTYGIGSFLKCKTILMIVRGEAKRQVLEKMLNGDPKLPASWLLEHRDLKVITDFPVN